MCVSPLWVRVPQIQPRAVFGGFELRGHLFQFPLKTMAPQPPSDGLCDLIVPIQRQAAELAGERVLPLVRRAVFSAQSAGGRVVLAHLHPSWQRSENVQSHSHRNAEVGVWQGVLSWRRVEPSACLT